MAGWGGQQGGAEGAPKIQPPSLSQPPEGGVLLMGA